MTNIALSAKQVVTNGCGFCTELDIVSVEMLDERPLACANKRGATEEIGVFIEIDAAMPNRAVLQLGQTPPCLVARSLTVPRAKA
jgi:hypothetical protein